jgi:hypothetical protein
MAGMNWDKVRREKPLYSEHDPLEPRRESWEPLPPASSLQPNDGSPKRRPRGLGVANARPGSSKPPAKGKRTLDRLPSGSPRSQRTRVQDRLTRPSEKQLRFAALDPEVQDWVLDLKNWTAADWAATFIRDVGTGYYDREVERIGIAVANRMKTLGWPSTV